MRIVLLLGCFLLSACTPRGDLHVVPEAAGVGEEVDVYIATTRRLIRSGDPSRYRSDTVDYLFRAVSVPPERTTGSVTFPDPPFIDPQTEFVATEARLYDGPAAFRRDLSRARAARPGPEREVVVYVHGFNNTFAEGVLRIAQLSHDLELPAVAVHYSWPTYETPLGYGYDRDSVLFARDGLEELLRILADTGSGRVLIVAHSLGAQLTMEALRQIAIADPGWPQREIDGVVLVSPDIDIDVFKLQALRVGPLPQPFAIFVSERDRVLEVAARLSGRTRRLGNIDDPERLSEFDVTLLDVTAFSTGAGHFTAASSPALLALLRRLGEVERAFEGDRSGRVGLLAGSVLTVRNATEILLMPDL